ncbi:MAG: aromatic ring-hydroxylating dioxygenase subunit alpha [Alphaproteobacteria bacterium]|nr:MAG: aromatic ring-hydroxylating dioxygenase subunit alpha [Alphaproteobacteria bacterium]
MTTRQATRRETDQLPPEEPTIQDLLDQETRPVPDFLRETINFDLGNDPIPAERYTSEAFHRLEVERMWTKVWQMACREEEIPEPGDHIVYDIADKSILVVRTGTGAIRAYHNSCLHRGRQLRSEDGSVNEFRCPFHGFTWDLEGRMTRLPTTWDFPHVAPDKFCLPEVKVGTWGGFVFINMDPDCMPLEEYLKPLPRHFERWDLANAYKAVHVAKVVPANWKATAEAFMEAFHSQDTHPQILVYTGDINSQYDVFDPDGMVNRAIHAMAVPSPYVEKATDQEVVDAIVETSGRMDGGTEALEVPEGKTARAFMGDINRRVFGQMAGEDYSDITDCEVLDAIVYNVFPNFAPWGGFNPNIIYRWRPNGNDPNSCLMEVMILMRFPKDQERPAPVPVHWLGEDEPWTNAPELGALGAVFEQDMGNLPYVQRGLRASESGRVQLASYQESRIRHFHYLLGKFVGE